MPNEEYQYLTGKDAIKLYSQQRADDVNSNTVLRSNANGWSSRTFVGHDTNISVKSDYYRGDYEYFRPSKAIPSNQIDIIAMCMEAYNKNGIVRNIIDLMSEFASYGIKLQHPRKSTENFYNKWFKDTVHGPEVSCSFIRLLFKAGNVIVKRNNGVISVLDEAEWRKSISSDLQLDTIIVVKREIPIRYTFINPVSVEMIGAEIANFIGKPILNLKVPSSLRSSITKNGTTDNKSIKKLMDSIPKDLLASLKSGSYSIPLDMDKIEIFYYKKEDWMPWAYPITASLLNDLIMLEQMKLADISALDGAISNIRLWTLGVIDGANSIFPNKSVINKLRNILANNVGGGVLDLVWGPELSFTESNSQVWRFLGSEKYEATLSSIYEGFGIPPTMRAGGGSTNTGNFVGLNTLVKRLQYVREVLIRFWKKEITIVHKAMNFKGPVPRIVFDNMVLADEAAEKQLLINLWDRDLISTESIREIFGRIPEVEEARVKTEFDDRNNDAMPEKASPFHNPDKEHEYKKILIQAGDVTPSEVGLTLMERKEGEKPRIDKTLETQVEMKKIFPPGPPGGTRKTGTPGRPSSVTETKKRKPKPTSKPSTKADVNIFLWANSIQDEIHKILQPAMLSSFGKDNMRKLTSSESEVFDHIKNRVLSNLPPLKNVDEIVVAAYMNMNIKEDYFHTLSSIKRDFVQDFGTKPNLEQNRFLCACAYMQCLNENYTE